MLKLALAGTAHIHTPGFIDKINSREDVEVSQVWDHDATRGALRAQKLSATFVPKFEQILEGDAVAVLVCSETDLHEELVLPLAEARKHLFVEKPLGIGAADAFRMAAAIERERLTFSTGYFMRGNPQVRFLREQIEAGSFGQITRVRGSNCHSGALGGWFDGEWRWMADPKRAGVGAFGDLGTHSLDLLMWLFGDVTRATALLSPGTARYEGCDETGEGLMQFESGAIGTLAAAWDDVANPVSLLISGTQGHAAIVNGELFFQSSLISGADGKTPYSVLPSAVPAGFDSFLDVMTGKGGELVTASEAAKRSAVMEAMYEGAIEGRWSDVKTG